MLEFLKKNRMVITIVSVVLLAIMRAFVLLLGIDPVNGYSRVSWLSTLQIGICVIALAAAIAPDALDQVKYAIRTTKTFRIVTAIVAVAFLAYAVLSMLTFWNELIPAYNNMEIALPWKDLLKIVLGLMSVVFFFLLFRGGCALPNNRTLVFILGPIGIYTIRIIDNFMTATLNPAVDTYVIMMLGYCAALLFFTTLGRTLLEAAVNRWFKMASGAAAMLLAVAIMAAAVFRFMPVAVYLPSITLADIIIDGAVILLAIVAPCLSSEDVAERRKIRYTQVITPLRAKGIYTPKH